MAKFEINSNMTISIDTEKMMDVPDEKIVQVIGS